MFFIPESPKFLYTHKKFEEARQTLLNIAKFNGKQMRPFKFDTEIDDKAKVYNDINQSKQTTPGTNLFRKIGEEKPLLPEQPIVLKGTIKEVCQIRVLRQNFIGLMVALSTTSFCYFLINFQMNKVKGSIVKNTLSN